MSLIHIHVQYADGTKWETPTPIEAAKAAPVFAALTRQSLRHQSIHRFEFKGNIERYSFIGLPNDAALVRELRQWPRLLRQVCRPG